MSDKKKIIITVLSVVCCLLVGGIIYLRALDPQQTAHTSQSLLFKAVNDLYEARDYAGAHEKIKGMEQTFLELPDGCELMVSVYAESDLEAAYLERVSRLCMEKSKAPGIAHEGFAKALISQQRGAEAILILQKELIKHPLNDRLFAVLSYLSLMNGDHQLATKYLSEAIEVSSIWSAWLSRFMKTKELSSEKDFLKEIAASVLKKDPVPQGAVASLIEALKEKGEMDLAERVVRNSIKE